MPRFASQLPSFGTAPRPFRSPRIAARHALSWRAALALLATLSALACVPRFDGSVYRGDGFAFKVAKVPVGWQRLDDDRSALSFSDLANRGAVLINGRCGRDEDVPLKALTQHLFIAFTERNIETEELVPFDQREALHTTLSAKLDGVPLRYDVWVLKRNGCVFDLLYFAPPERFQAGVPGFAEFVRGFTSRVADGP